MRRKLKQLKNTKILPSENITKYFQIGKQVNCLNNSTNEQPLISSKQKKYKEDLQERIANGNRGVENSLNSSFFFTYLSFLFVESRADKESNSTIFNEGIKNLNFEILLQVY